MNGIFSIRGTSVYLWAAWVGAIAAAILLTCANLLLGNLNQDEGWYLYAAWQVFSGKMPYRDFAFTQGPVLPYFYALFYPLIHSGGLIAGRLITATIALIGTVMAAILAGRLARNNQAPLVIVMTFILALVNVYQIYFCTVVKTYSLALFFTTSGFLALHHALTRNSSFLTMLAGALIALAAGTRSSAAFILPVVLILLWLKRRQTGFACWFYFMLGGILTSFLIAIPFLIESPGNFIYFAGRFHTLRAQGSLISALIFKIGFLSRVFQAYYLCLAIWITAMTIRLAFRNNKGDCSAYAVNSNANSIIRTAIWLSALAVSGVHLSAPFPYDDYQVFIYPLFAIASALIFVEQTGTKAGQWALAAVFCLALVASFSSPINQDWVIEKRELIWWRTKDKPPIVKLRETARFLQSISKPNDLLLTQDPYLAVESRRRLPPGLEMGQFSYFPDLTDEQAEAMNVHNRNSLAKLLQNCDAPVAALSGYAFAIQSPQITPLPAKDKAFFEEIISKRYQNIGIVYNFGQASTELRLFRLRQNSADRAGGQNTETIKP